MVWGFVEKKGVLMKSDSFWVVKEALCPEEFYTPSEIRQLRAKWAGYTFCGTARQSSEGMFIATSVVAMGLTTLGVGVWLLFF